MGSIAGYMERAIDKLVELGTVLVCFAPTEVEDLYSVIR